MGHYVVGAILLIGGLLEVFAVNRIDEASKDTRIIYTLNGFAFAMLGLSKFVD